MADSGRVRSIDISGAIKNLVGLGLIAVKPGSGRYANEYLRPCRSASPGRCLLRPPRMRRRFRRIP
jgi:hypothetical protein